MKFTRRQLITGTLAAPAAIPPMLTAVNVTPAIPPMLTVTAPTLDPETAKRIEEFYQSSWWPKGLPNG